MVHQAILNMTSLFFYVFPFYAPKAFALVDNKIEPSVSSFIQCQ